MNNYNLNRLNVLLVEKHAYMRHMLRDILRQLGIREVRECNNVKHALEMFEQSPPDLVITDWAPGLDGIELVKQLRQDDGPNRFVPVIIISANTEARHIYQALDAGMTEFLAKPITAKQVYSRVRMVIEKRRIFISNEDFFGPDRRRMRKKIYNGDDRRSLDCVAEA